MKKTAKQSTSFKYLALLALVLVFIHSSFGLNYQYAYRFWHILSRYPIHFLCNWFIFFGMAFILAIVIRKKLYHTLALVVPNLILATISRLKYENVGQPLLHSDIILLQYSETLVSYLTTTTYFSVSATLILFVAALFYFSDSKFNQNKINLKGWGVWLNSSMGIFLVYVFLTMGNPRFMGISLPIIWEPSNNYLRNGDVVGFLQNIYVNQNPIERYKGSHQNELIKEPEVANACRKNLKPDILVIMVESLFDPTQLPRIKLAKDPIAPLRNLGFPEQKSYMFVPVYGGGTASTEFEFLTGSTQRFFPRGTVQFQHHIYQPVNSIARELKKSFGYKAIGIHNNTQSFWRRDEVYPLMGFDKFIGLEDMGKRPPKYKNTRPKDDILTKIVPAQLKANASTPGFYYIVTMGMHGGYENEFWEGLNKLKFESDYEISDFGAQRLENYGALLDNSSGPISEVILSALSRKKPTVVLYFGDHMPSLPDDVLVASGYYDWLEREVEVKENITKVVPMSVLNNFDCQMRLPKTVASNCIAGQMFQKIMGQNPSDKYWQGNINFCNNTPFIYDRVDPSALVGDMAKYASLMYENLFEWEEQHTEEK